MRRASLHSLRISVVLALAAGLLAFMALPARAAEVRADQVGYLPTEPKIAMVRSATNLEGTRFDLVARRDGSIMLSGTLPPSDGGWSGAAFHHRVDFSALNVPGVYRVQLAGGEQSYAFTIADDAFSRLPSLILLHLKQQRCGADGPLLHGPCHRDDGQIQDGPRAGTHRDMSGGWHDAGDYLKFAGTSSYTTYFLLRASEQHPEAWRDADRNGVPDVLDEARHGLDWLEKIWDPTARVLYTQVGDIADHDEGWRLPQNDRLMNRPAWSCAAGSGANIAGRLAASMALAATIWAQPGTSFFDPALAARWDALAVSVYAFGKLNEGSETGRPTWLYAENSWTDDMELGAAELFRRTGTSTYLDDARSFATLAGPAWWFNWSAENALSHRVLWDVEPDPVRRATLVSYLVQDLDSFETEAAGNPMKVAVPFVWGSADAQMGAAVVAGLHREMTNDTAHEAMRLAQLHYVLGGNQWGVSYLVGAGADYPDDLHNQIDFVSGAQINGAFTEGGVTRADFVNEGIVLDAPDEYAAFQSATAVYHDDTADYMTNEPTIAGDMAIMTVLADRFAADATLLRVRKDVAAPAGAFLYWTGVSGSYDAARSDSPRDVNDNADARVVAPDLDALAWLDPGPTPTLTFYSVSAARRLR